MGIKRVIKKIFLKVYKRISPVKFAKLIGVNFDVSTVHIYGNVHWNTEPWLITLGRDVYITDGVKFITHDGGTLIYRDLVSDLEITKPITVGDKVYIGNNVIILPGVKIGSNVIIGAGAVVTKSVPDNSVVAGVPAKVIKSADEYLEKIKKESIHLGNLKGKEEDIALRKYYNYTGDAFEIN